MKAKAKFLTVTLNPAIDETIFLDRLTPGTVHRAAEYRRQAGGKGVNVAAMIADAGHSVTATGFLGDENARVFERLFAARGVEDAFVRLPGETRAGIKIVDRAARDTTDVNLPGLAPTAEHLDALERIVREWTDPGAWVAVTGSLPPDVEPAYVARLVAAIKARGGLVAVDTSGPSLRAAIDAGADMVKPNEAELGELVGRDLGGFNGALAAAADLRRAGVSHVVVSLGHEGALFLAPDQSVLAGAPTVEVISTVGAGDALLAGYLVALAEGKTPAERARDATVFAWCALESLARELVEPAERAARAARISVQPVPS